MKSMKQKKLAALALSAAMLFSAVPLHAFAAATPNKADYEETDKNFAKLRSCNKIIRVKRTIRISFQYFLI